MSTENLGLSLVVMELTSVYLGMPTLSLFKHLLEKRCGIGRQVGGLGDLKRAKHRRRTEAR